MLTRLGHTFGLTSSPGKTGKGGTYSRAIVNELKAAKHEAFSRPQGESPGIMFVGFFHEKCLLAIVKYIMVIPATHIVCRGST